MKREDIIYTKKIDEELEALKKRSPDLTDTDALEITDWSQAERGKFYRPRKQQVTIRLDMDVLAWFKHEAGKYQTLINKICRDYMNQHKRKRVNK